ncbi:nucleotide pyrophosphohydrolase [Patescibacteria group bacterium]|nr:nucleotide pyrophosphohydrolase [Patescibacteria group bacterium]
MNEDKNTTIQELKDLLREFRDKRDWKQFHNLKDLAEAISIEAGELQELFLWKNKEQIAKKLKEDEEFRKEIGEEFADIVIFCLNFANASDIDISAIVKKKAAENDKKYSVEKAKGTATKYNKL